jgi:hypothetical protein
MADQRAAQRRLRSVCGCIIWIAIIAFSTNLRAATATPEMIDEAIKKGCDYLYGKQSKGNWEITEKRDTSAASTEMTGG